LLADEPEPPAKLLDGTPKVLVVHGYSTSRQWPQVLQRKLDRHFGGRRVVEVQSAIQGGTPIAKWMNADTGERLPAWNEVLAPKLKRDDDRPTVVLAQQSLQWAYGGRSEGIRGPEDKERIERGADVLQRYAEALLEDGADRVFIGMHIYKRPMEPAIGNERLALAELVKRGLLKVHAGPDVWSVTRERYPEAFARDGVHPNELGAEIMAQAWFEALLRHDGLEVPEWSRQESNGKAGR
jgi:lysophospholipase L1-like esterase